MASSYVNDLRLNEMATGDASGTWGTNTNVNLELIGEGLGYGTEAITTNADTHASVVADGATDPVRAMYVEYTGTLDSACTITISPNTINRMHFIENGTSGSQNIIISQGSGANITIPPGDTKAVYLDGAGSGAAVVDAFASLSVVDLKVQDDLTVTDDATIGGTLGVTGIVTLTDDLIIGDGKTIGSASDVDAMTIASNGQITLTQTLIGTALDISGDIDVDGVTNLDNTDIDGTLDVSGQVTFADGSAGAPSISNTGDVNAGLFFSAADVMSFSAGGTAQFTMADGSISPVTDNDIDLGTASLKYKSFFAGLVDAENFKINGGQGSDGQVLTSTGSGVAFEDAAGGGPTFKVFGTSSIMVGDDATGTIDAANLNTALGVDVFAALTTGDNNTAVGFKALTGNTTGAGNTGIGKGAGYRITTGNDNLFVGHSDDSNAGATTGSSNTMIGRSAGERTTSGNSNTFVGALCGDLHTTSNTNTGVGASALTALTTGANNTAVGSSALAACTTGASNICIGTSAGLAMTTPTGNVAIGHGALETMTDSQFNTAVGYQAGNAVTSAVGVVLMGYQAGDAITTGDTNICIGGFSMDGGAGKTGYGCTHIGHAGQRTGTSGNFNCSMGIDAYKNPTTGASNTILGSAAGAVMTTGSSNTFVGGNAGQASTTGSENCYIGKSAGHHETAMTVGNRNNVMGAYSAPSAVNGNDQIVLGNDVKGTANATMTVGVSDNTASLALDGSDTSWAAASSDERLKENIETSKLGLNFINDLRPVNYNWKKGKDVPTDMPQYKEGSEEPVLGYEYGKSQHGFIAQECKAVQDKYADDLADGFRLWIEKDDGTQTVADGNLIPVLVKAMQEMSTQVNELKSELLALKGE